MIHPIDGNSHVSSVPDKKEEDILSEFKEWEKAQNPTEIDPQKAQIEPTIDQKPREPRLEYIQLWNFNNFMSVKVNLRIRRNHGW